MIYVVISIAVIFAVVIISGSVLRKNIYKEVDRIERWKSDVTNRPVAEEISRVKGLTISGETEEKFESWRKDWDDIIDVHLPDIEEALFDIEEWANKYRFKKSKELIKAVEVQLEEIENQIDNIMTDVNELVHSEEKNRSDIGEVKEKYQDVKKYISLHWRSFGKAGNHFEKKLKEVEEGFSQFEKETLDGNYLQARTVLTTVKEELSLMKEQSEEIPSLLIEIESDFPAELKDIEAGMEDMREKGYQLDNFSFEKDIQAYREELPKLVKDVENLELQKVRDRLEELHRNLEGIYTSLEEEVDAREYVESTILSIKNDVERLQYQLQELGHERGKVELSYRIPEDEVNRQQKVKKEFEQADKSWRVFKDLFENKKQSFTSLKNMLKDLSSDLSQIDKMIRASKETLYTLRKDELKALDNLKELRKQMVQEKLALQKSRLPYVPGSLVDEMEKADEMLSLASKRLQDLPLEMNKVYEEVEKASLQLQKTSTYLRETIEKAELSESLIQYGNRFRRQSPEVDEALMHAEQKFRQGAYEEAVNLALPAIENKEPQVLEKVKERAKERA
ncbi:septation ring formation regulator EzrA [Thalassobacillus sp. C254]|uniref:septation ring formation regulator EzrA n=1 Tax=Thalassobacillus sp. C254 TaxID=1225341 RepID=UPI0006CFFB83|nr:septation ring formation regulator EzrA [Thalassobacillus sp. C254]